LPLGFSLVVFGDVPNGWTLFGGTIMVLMGIYTFARERRIKRITQQTSNSTLTGRFGVGPAPL